jgi:recombinational DNA repair ATPase RecF
MKINLHNWRCFRNQTFEIDFNSQIWIGENGLGKTSLLSALYTLFSQKPWPQTKFGQNLTFQKSYFGISSEYENFNFTAQIAQTGRLRTQFNLPENWNFLNLNNKPIIFTYTPIDNLWLFQSRSNKIGILDNLLGQLFGDKYSSILKKLSLVVNQKQRYIKAVLDGETSNDKILISNFTEQIYNYSVIIWDFRRQYFEFLKTNFLNLNDWLEILVNSWQINWQITDLNGNRGRNNYQNFDFNEDFVNDLWTRELASKKVLFSATRDDFEIFLENLNVNQILSRGEMRLLVLFLKLQAVELLKKQDLDLPIWWFVDDIFNEFDKIREEVLVEKILNRGDLFLATGTRLPTAKFTNYNLSDLTR